MRLIIPIAVLLCLVILLSGCGGKNGQPDRSVLEDTKLSDIAPTENNSDGSLQKIKSVTFQCQIFEVPAENTDTLGEIFDVLYGQPLHFKHFKAFNANSFRAGFGRIGESDLIFHYLSEADAVRGASISLVIGDEGVNYIPVFRLFDQKTIYYTSEEGKTESKTIGPGILSLKITAKRIPAYRGVCDVVAIPAMPSPLAGALSNTEQRPDIADMLFDCCLVSLRMSPGDYLFLTSDKYISHQNSLGSIFFSRTDPIPQVLAFLIVCTDISD